MTQTHYYGDRVRSLLVAVAVIMVVGMPFFSELIPKPSFFSILSVLVIVLLSGWISPRHKMVVSVTTIVSALAFIVFQYNAINAYQLFGLKNFFFVINEFLAVLCLTATYFGTKSIRGLIQAEGLD